MAHAPPDSSKSPVEDKEDAGNTPTAVVAPGAPDSDAGNSNSNSGDGTGDGAPLLEKLVQQLEFYFSRQNLATDTYLISQMNANKFVSVDIIAQFPKILRLTTDRTLLLEAMRACSSCTLDSEEKMLRPTVQFARDTLILRDIPATTPEDEIRAIFNFDGAGKVMAVRSEVGNNWYVTLDSEESCQATAMALLGRTFKGEPIRARVKNSSVLRGVYKPPAGHSSTVMGPPGGAPFMPATAMYDGQGQSPDASPDGQGGRWQPNPYFQQPPMYMGQPGPGHWNPGYMQWAPGHGGMPPFADGSNPEYGPNGMYHGRRPQPGRTGRDPRGMNGMDGNPAARKKKPKTKRKPRDSNGAAYTRKPQRRGAPTPMPSSKDKEPQLGPEHFPALPSSAPKKTASFGGKKYSREEMARIVRTMNSQSLAKPDTFPEPQECPVVRGSPLSDCQLLKPFPIMYPASPSPMLEPQPKEVLAMMPDLDLSADSGHTRDKASGARSKSGRWLTTPLPTSGSSFDGSLPFEAASVEVGGAIVRLVNNRDSEQAKENRPAAAVSDGSHASGNRSSGTAGDTEHKKPTASNKAWGSTSEAAPKTASGASEGGPADPTDRHGHEAVSSSRLSYADLLKKAVPKV